MDASFILTPIQSHSGLSLPIIFFSTPLLKPLCITSTSVNSLPMLAHKICKSTRFQTFTNYTLVNPSSVSVDTRELSNSNISCNQSSSYNTSCSITTMSSPCHSFLSLECGSCHSHVHLTPNSSIILESPLYPVLQPDMICQYDLKLDEEVSADITIDIDDLSLPPPQYSSSHSGHCITSYLHILSGSSFSQMNSLATLCGEGSNIFNLRLQNVLRFQLVTGSWLHARKRRGFRLTVQVSSPLYKIDMVRVGVYIAYFVGLILVIGALVAGIVIFQKCKTQERKRRPRRGVTWHGSAPQPGHSLHMDRTEYISRQLGTVEESIEAEARENVYSSLGDGVLVNTHYNATSGNFGLRSLPATPLPVSNSNYTSSETEGLPGLGGMGEDHKIYETMNSTFSSTDSHSSQSFPDRPSNSSSPSQLPSLPRRPSWTLQTPITVYDQSGSPMYLCLPGPDQSHERPGQLYASPARDRKVTVKLSEASLDDSSKNGSIVGCKVHRDQHSSGSIFNTAENAPFSVDHPPQTPPVLPSTSTRQSMLSDTTRKVSKLLAKVSLSEQSTRLRWRLSQPRAEIGEECLITGMEEDGGERDEVFY